MEIMAALIIMALAFLPIIGVIGSSTKDTDIANSTVFAQTTARNILDTILDDVPFNSINPDEENGNIAKIDAVDTYNEDSVNSFLSMIGASNNIASGVVVDERGISYNITIYVWPIEATNKTGTEVSTDTELQFAYLPRPLYESQNDSWYNNSIFNTSDVDPYGIDVATVTINNAFELGAQLNASNYCVMKKILFKMEWQSRGRTERNSLELYTMKANLDSDGKPIGS